MKITRKFRVTNTDYLLSIDTSGYHKNAWCEIVDSSLPNPAIKSVMQGSIRLHFEPRCINHDVVLIVHFDEPETKSKQKTEVDFSSLGKRVLTGVLCTLIGLSISLCLNLAYKKLYLNESESWKSKIEEEDFKVGSNDRAYYESDKIKQLELDYTKENSLSSKYKFKDLFHYTEHGVYIMKDAVRFADGIAMIFTRKQASEYCSDNFDGRILSDKEYSKYIITGIADSFKSPFSRARDTTEWTSKTHPEDNDYYKILTKKLVQEGSDIKKYGGFTFGEEDEVGAGFRCAMFNEDWEESK
jgi:hypothetical protein